MRFITSLNPRSRIKRQQDCIDSWTKYNIPIVAIQHESEYHCEALFKSVQFHYVETPPNLFATIFPSINSLFNFFPGIIINSDIFLTWTTSQFNSYIQHDKLVGIRTENGVLNRFGIDVFLSSTPTSLPENPFHVGKPGWDYYVMLEWCAQQPHVVKEGIIHEAHEDRWNLEQLAIAQDLLANHYNMTSREVTLKVQRITNRA